MRQEPRAYLWHADPQAHDEILAAAERWCRQRGRRVTQSLSVGTMGPVAVGPGKDVLDRMHEAVLDRMHVELCLLTADGFRSVAARAWSGGVSFVEGGAWIHGGRWAPALAELTGLLRDQADQLTYGFIRRGWAVDEALLDHSLAHDWPHAGGS